jgi:predicted dehydrogenase
VKALRIAVCGAGHMGRYHAEKLAAMAREGEGVALCAVADVVPERARELAEATGTRACGAIRELLPLADAVVVAVPTVAHFDVVSRALEAGLDVLVEKPLAATLAEAEALIALGHARERILQVGHLERFNSALRTLRGLIHRPRFIEAHRLGPFPARATDVDVVRDLMIHDLDIIQELVGEEPESVEAIGVPVLTSKVDIANARLRFPSGCVANVTASRVSPTPLRKLRLFQADGYFSIDFLASSAVIMRRVQDKEGEPPRIELDKLELDREDALREELRSFVRAVRERKEPEVPGEQALRALRTALRVVEAMPPLDELR